MHWIFIGIALGVGIMLAPYVIAIVVDIVIVALAIIGMPFVWLSDLLNGIGEMSEWIADRNRAKRLAREKAAT